MNVKVYIARNNCSFGLDFTLENIYKIDIFFQTEGLVQYISVWQKKKKITQLE